MDLLPSPEVHIEFVYAPLSPESVRWFSYRAPYDIKGRSGAPISPVQRERPEGAGRHCPAAGQRFCCGPAYLLLCWPPWPWLGTCRTVQGH